MPFFERFLVSPQQGDPPSAKAPAGELSSIARNLGNILAGKQGYASWVHDYGLIRYSAQSTSRNVAQTLLDEILDNIARYEPRLTVYSLAALDKDADHRLHLILRGAVRGVRCIIHLAFWMTLGWLAVVEARWEEPDGRK